MSDIFDRLPKACPTCRSEQPTTYYGSCFDNVHSTIFDPRLPMDPWHAYMNELRHLIRKLDAMTGGYEVCRDGLVEVRAERDALAARLAEVEAEAESCRVCGDGNGLVMEIEVIRSERCPLCNPPEPYTEILTQNPGGGSDPIEGGVDEGGNAYGIFADPDNRSEA